MKRCLLWVSMCFCWVGPICSQTVLRMLDLNGSEQNIEISTGSHISFVFDSIVINPRQDNDTLYKKTFTDLRKIWFNEIIEEPVFSPGEGTYTEPQTINISCANEDVLIYYTLDGTDPINSFGTIFGSLYSVPLLIEETTIIKAVAIKSDNHSSVVTAVYTIEGVVNGINDVERRDFIIYPNPSGDFFTIEGINKDCQLVIYSMKGDEILKTYYSLGDRINISSLQSGNYFVIVGGKVGKLIKK